MKRSIITIICILVATTFSKAQDQKQFMKYIKSVEKKLDSLQSAINRYENETQAKMIELNKQNEELSKNAKLVEEKKLEIENLNLEIDEKTRFIESQELYMGIFLGISAIALISIVALFSILKDKKRINKELITKSDLVKSQMAELKLKNKEITDSIKYAKKIQDAILPSSTEIKSVLPESFVYYRPKDIVSGDFYYINERNNNIYFATADCTGHGVPGALMSILGISYLNEIMNEKKVLKPGLILDELKKSIINSLNKKDEGSGMKDGMDMSIYNLDLTNMKLTYSAANNGIYILRENQVIKLNPDKQPVSANPRDNINFTENSFDIKKGDLVITYSDGFADQFGGPKGKKFKSKQLMELLVQVHNKPTNTIPQLLNTSFEKWKGKLEQVDDVLIAGVRV